MAAGREIAGQGSGASRNPAQTSGNLCLTEDKFSRIFKSSPDWIVLSTLEEGRFIEVNEAFCRITGYDHEEVIGRTATELGLWVDHEERREMVAILREKRKIRDHEVRFRTKSNEIRTMLRSAELIELGDETCIISVTRDITERKEAEEKLRVFSRELERSNRELEQFSFVVSHDLQTPLLTVACNLKLALRRCGGEIDVESESFLKESVKALDRMQARIRGLLAYSLVGGREQIPAPTDFNAILSQILADLSVSIRESGARVMVGDLPVLRADGNQIAQVFQNLIHNAIKFRGTDPLEIIVAAERQSCGEWLFSVQDNGSGIPKEAKGRVFELFARVDRSVDAGGDGIGLATCKKILESHGGRIWVESEPGRGSTFFFTLPETKLCKEFASKACKPNE